MTLDECLDTLRAQLEQDHWRVAFALVGRRGPAPRDPELALLHAEISAQPGPCALIDVASEHPEAASRHMAWVTETLPRPRPSTRRTSVPSATPVTLPLAA